MAEEAQTIARVRPAPQRRPYARIGGIVWGWIKPLLVLLVHVWTVVTIMFVLAHLMPGDPAVKIAGPYATPESIAAIHERLGLDKSLWQQYVIYVTNLFHGDLGTAISTGNAVSDDLAQRVPATLGLITIAIAVSGLLCLLLTWVVVAKPRGPLSGPIRAYSVVSPSIPDFMAAIALVFVFYYLFGLFPAPSGMLDSSFEVTRITGFPALDALLTGNFEAFGNAAAHLVLPVASLALVNTGLMARLTIATALSMQNADHIRFARALGVSHAKVNTYILRSSLPTFVSTMSLGYASMLGGAVLIETVFGWGGIGQYATAAVTQSDYTALQGFVIVAGVFTALVYAVANYAYKIADPRSRR